MMRSYFLQFLFFSAVVGIFLFVPHPVVFSQSQAQNGQIEGTVLDQNNASVPGAVVTVTNIETGATRAIKTAESGVFRFPLLPLGTYRITAEAAHFKKLVREGVILATGQTASIELVLEAGEIREVLTVTADSSVADAGRTDLGRVINTGEVQNLPLIQRNPYNLGLLQANVTGRPSRGFNFPSFNVNGYLRRVNFQLDGNTNTSFDRRARFLNLSETSVSEIQLVTNGFAPEFGDTPGMIMNIVTPSGTNALHGAVSYRFRQPSFYSRPFFFPAADLPDNNANIFTVAVGGPIIIDRWHFYFGYERQYRDDKASAARLLTITPANRDRLIAAGLSPSIFPAAIPGVELGSTYIFRTDLQINSNNRMSARINHSDVNTKNAIGGRFNTLERTIDSASVDSGFGAQLASYTLKVFNEFRFGFAQSNSVSRKNEFSGTGPTITIPGVANFGPSTQADTVAPPLKITQFQDNLTRLAGTHVIKFGGGFSRHDYSERAAIFSIYRFTSINNYIAARTGANPRGYSTYEQNFGDPDNRYKATYWNFFVQDDWKFSRRLKFSYGLRYDFYLIPKADPTSLFPLSQHFKQDKNDFAPRLGMVYSLREGNRPTILRVGAGIYYEAPLLAIYRDVIKFNGNPRFFSLSFTPNTPGSPAFPNTLANLPPGTVPPQQDIYTIARDYQTMYAIHSHIQLEQAITENMSFAVGYVHSAGRHLNVYRNINAINPVRFLADGRPVFGNDRLDPRFGTIVIAESDGVANYDALALQLKQRLSGGVQFSVNYTLSKAVNDTPDGDIEGLFLSDPTNRGLDRGFSSADQRHTFGMSMVLQPKFNIKNKMLRRLFNNNQFGIIATANSGQRFNIYADVIDLNGDGIDVDRPVGVKRNAGKAPPQVNADLRYSRFFNFGERFKLEVFGEFQNVLNINSIVGYSNVLVDTDPMTGEVIGPFPDFRARNQSISQESRQFQLGLKFIF